MIIHRGRSRSMKNSKIILPLFSVNDFKENQCIENAFQFTGKNISMLNSFQINWFVFIFKVLNILYQLKCATINGQWHVHLFEYSFMNKTGFVKEKQNCWVNIFCANIQWLCANHHILFNTLFQLCVCFFKFCVDIR